jgi:hypothetical protein
VRRIGEQTKCPACGWGLDASAYRCPKCRIFFCYKCRARVGREETQYQCANQACDCYGKLLCCACVAPVHRVGPVPAYDISTAHWIWLFIGAVALGLIVGDRASGEAGFWAGVGLICTGGPLLYFLTFHRVPGPIGSDICCVECRQPAKRL